MNANVYTVNPNHPWAQAVAVQGDKIIFVGTDSEVKKYADTKTELIDCKGQFLMPGVNRRAWTHSWNGRIADQLEFDEGKKLGRNSQTR